MVLLAGKEEGSKAGRKALELGKALGRRRQETCTNA